jgi:hypothetical protein
MADRSGSARKRDRCGARHARPDPGQSSHEFRRPVGPIASINLARSLRSSSDAVAIRLTDAQYRYACRNWLDLLDSVRIEAARCACARLVDLAAVADAIELMQPLIDQRDQRCSELSPARC